MNRRVDPPVRDLCAELGRSVAPKADLVNHPPHYSASRFGVECIAITRHMTFDAGNAFKYIWRHADKGTPVQDLSKAAWYLRDLEFDGRGRVWITPNHRAAGQGLIRAHVIPRITDNDLTAYLPLRYIGEDWLDRALLAVENAITDYCDACDGRGRVDGFDCGECGGSGLRVDQDRNMR